VTIQEALKFRYGSDKIQGKLIGVQGMGKVGSCLGERLLSEGADLIVCDMNRSRADAFLKRNQSHAREIQVVSASEITMQMGHVLSPCAQGGVLSRDSIQEIGYHIIAGSASLVMKASTPDEELVLADYLMKKGVLYIPDWISGIGTTIYTLAFVLSQEPVDLPTIQKQIEDRCRPCLRELLQNSKSQGVTPLELAYKTFEPVVFC
jgi:glutamate dehydrogenase/leucine dehydrogenase